MDTQRHSCPKGFGKPVTLGMDEHRSQSHPRSSNLRVSTKSRAPSPPGLKELDSQRFSHWCPGTPHLTMEQKDNLNDKELSLTVVLPGGVERTTVVHGSKPLMDLLVTLCAKYHLNPSSHTLELVTTNRNHVKLKPNALIGSLDAEKILLKPKGEDKNKKTGPHMPEATVRMVINYKKTQKAILRVNPRVPLAELLPAICEKCEFDIETTVLLKDVQSLAPLDLSSSLNDYAIREVYARDTKGPPASPVSPGSPTVPVTPGKDKDQKEKENKGLFSKFRRSRKKSEQPATVSAPASPVLVSKPRPLSMALSSSNSSPLSSPTIPSDVPKKRRAPQPPVLVSQDCPPDLSPRRRLSSELDSDQMTGLSCGSSAESTLKRTKRKAPPPPTSPSATVQESVLQDRGVQVDTGSNTLEEIMEQEETTASVMSETASKTQEDCTGVTTSADVTLPPPPSDVEIQSNEAVEADGEDQSCDLSSDGNCLETRVDDLCVEKIDDEVFSETGDPDNSQIHVEKANTETLRELTDDLQSPTAPSTSRPAGEDAQVQTDFPPFPDTSQQHDDCSVSGLPFSVKPAGKKDMGTLTKDLDTADLNSTSSHTTEAVQNASPLKNTSSLCATDFEPKPRPSNEVTRDYIPKVGMTTYTIVPPKSLEKLRYFEVELTLEAPAQAPAEELDFGSLHLDDNKLKGRRETSPASPRDDALMNTTPAPHTLNDRKPKSTCSPSPTTLGDRDTISSTANEASEAGSPAEVKEMKIPPTTKPKPGSFRLAQHKRTTGYYVTSAAEKSLSPSPGSGHKEAQSKANIPSPPSSPLVQCHEEAAEARSIQLSPKQEESNAASSGLIRQSSLPSREPSLGLSLEKLRSFAAPRPYSSATPSRFAQAVSSAVKRSKSLSPATKAPTSTTSPHVTPNRSPSSALQSKGLGKLQECENIEVSSDGYTQQGEDEAQSFNEIVQMGTESSL